MEPFYKVGDTVTIREDLKDLEGKIHFGLGSTMSNMAGKSYTIKECIKAKYTPSRPSEDGCLYRLEGDAGHWSWSSEAFCETPRDSIFKVGDKVMVRKDLTAHMDYSRIPFSVNSDMLKYAGKTATVIQVTDYYSPKSGLDGCKYELDVDNKFFAWSNDDLVKVEQTLPILNVGDKVTIRPDLEETDSDKIQYGVNYEMVEYAGEVCTIKRIVRDDYKITRPNQDGCRYILEEDDGIYSWSSEMFIINNLKTKQNENRFQKQEAVVSRGDRREGRIVRCRRVKSAIVSGYLSHKTVFGD